MRTILLSLVLLAPLATALPVVCGAECRVGADSLTGYTPPVLLLRSGSSVTWTTTDGAPHIQQEVRLSGATEPCFSAVSTGDEPVSLPVRFEIAADGLFATSDAATLRCENAIQTSAGHALQYYCALHPSMRAILMVADA